jgi:hypothetical protein
MVKRRRTQIAMMGSLCSLCNGSDVVLVESRNVRRPQDWLNRNWRMHLRRYEHCNECGVRVLLPAKGEAPWSTGLAAAHAEGTVHLAG